MYTTRNHWIVALMLVTCFGCNWVLTDRQEPGSCGDGVVQPEMGEECDPPTSISNGKGCSADCRTVKCGNGRIDTGEACDDGELNDNTGDCTLTCQRPTCGDGFFRTHGNTEKFGPYEVCDDGNQTNGDGCNPQCTLKGQVSVVAGTPGGKGAEDGTGTKARFAGISSLATSEDGRYLYARDRGACTLRRIDLASYEVDTIAGSEGECYYQNGIGRGARLSRNYAPIAVTSSTIYFGEGNELRAYDLANGSVTSCATLPEDVPSDLAINALAYDRDDPHQLYATTQGAVLSMQLSCHCASEISLSDCKLVTIAGASTGKMEAPLDGVGFDARFGYPMGLAADAKNARLFIGDGSLLRMMDLSTNAVVTLADSTSAVNRTSFSSLDQLCYDRHRKVVFAVELNFAENAVDTTVANWSTLRQYDPETREAKLLAGALGPVESSELNGFGVNSRFLDARALASNATLTSPASMLYVGEGASIRAVSLDGSYNVATPVGVLVEDPTFWGAPNIAVAARSVKPATTATASTSGDIDGRISELVIATIQGDLKAKSVDGSSPVRALASCPNALRHVTAVTAKEAEVFAFDGMAGGICRIDLDGKGDTLCAPGTEAKETCEWMFKDVAAREWTVSSIAYDGTNFFYVADKRKPALFRIHESGGPIDQLPLALTDIGGLDGLAYVETTATESTDGSPSVAAGHWLYATSALTNQVLRIDLDTQQVHFLGTGIPGTFDGLPEDAEFCHPVGVAVDRRRKVVFVADTICERTEDSGFQGHTIRQIDNLGGIETISTLLGPGPSMLVQGLGAQASVNYAMSLTYDDKSGSIFGVDSFENVVFKVE
jgi:cysteine-rich repeat protein